MSDISVEKLKFEVQEILKNADLYTVTSKSVRQQIERTLGCTLLERKKEIDALVMEFVNQRSENDNEEESADENGQKASSDESSDDSAAKKKSQKRAAAGGAVRRKPKASKRKSLNSNDSYSESDGSDSDYKVEKKKPLPKKKKTSGEASAGKGSGRKGTGFTRAYKLSPELSELMGGEDAMPRHEVVKRMWAMIKERNLYDPKNKQYAICDDSLLKVMKVKRFRTFGMLKHLKPHFID